MGGGVVSRFRIPHERAERLAGRLHPLEVADAGIERTVGLEAALHLAHPCAVRGHLFIHRTGQAKLQPCHPAPLGGHHQRQVAPLPPLAAICVWVEVIVAHVVHERCPCLAKLGAGLLRRGVQDRLALAEDGARGQKPGLQLVQLGRKLL